MTHEESLHEENLHEETLRAIPRHFRGALAPAREAAMRAHLPSCSRCRARYERHLLLGRLTRAAAPAQERIARGLGLASGMARPAPAPRTARPVLMIAVGALAVALLVIRSRRAGDSSLPDGLTARGSGRGAGASLWVYRVGADAKPRLATDRVSAGDELAFAYGNAAGKKYVAIFGVDEHRHAYWYFPAWPAGAPPTAAPAARSGPGPHELPEAIRHAFAGRRLDIYGVFSDEPLAVTAVEAALAGPNGAADAAIPRGAVVTRRAFEVQP